MMTRVNVFLMLFLIGLTTKAQVADSLSNQYTNSADNLLVKDSKFVIGGYGEVHYNQGLSANTYNNGDLDVHRIIMMFGYNFSRKTQFISELEFEHVSEVYVEQAFLKHRLSRYIDFRAGLMLTPMGIINEYHEPTSFNGVERPMLDSYLAPTTWREIGFGFSGTIVPASIKYQAYLMNGFNGYDGDAKLGGAKGLRKGRQKGAESYISAPNWASKIEYFGLRGLNVGLSAYFGNTQSTLYDGINKADKQAVAMADSSVVGISMIGLDTRYHYSGFQFRGQFYYVHLSNTKQYNQFVSSDLGSGMLGYYIEADYDVLRGGKGEMKLMPFLRYEYLNTHHSLDDITLPNERYKKTAITTGLSWHLTPGAVVKFDVQWFKDASMSEYSQTVNAGIGVMF